MTNRTVTRNHCISKYFEIHKKMPMKPLHNSTLKRTSFRIIAHHELSLWPSCKNYMYLFRTVIRRTLWKWIVLFDFVCMEDHCKKKFLCCCICCLVDYHMKSVCM
jgi:hypothetical protein